MAQLPVSLCAVTSWPWSHPWKVCGLCCSTLTTFNCYKTISISLTNSTELQLAKPNKNPIKLIFFNTVAIWDKNAAIFQHVAVLSFFTLAERTVLGQSHSFNLPFCSRRWVFINSHTKNDLGVFSAPHSESAEEASLSKLHLPTWVAFTLSITILPNSKA